MEYMLTKLYAVIDAYSDVFVKRLRKLIALPSVSSSRELRPEVTKTMHFVADKLRKLGVKVTMKRAGKEIRLDGEDLNRPPVLFGDYGDDLNKPTVLIYGHLDVEAVDPDDGWDTDPFTLTQVGDVLYGRGVTDNKGPIHAWISVIAAFKKIDISLPVNLKIVFEGMGEAGSEGLYTLLLENRNNFLKSVNYVVMSNNFWLGTQKPCITYATRGVVYFHIKMTCLERDVHSGVFGGSVHEAMSDLSYLFDSLTDNKGRILVPGIYDKVRDFTWDEWPLYDNIDFDSNETCNDIGHNLLINHDNNKEIFLNRFRFPWLSIHGIEGDCSAPGAATVIPSKLIGKLSIRTVPDQDEQEIIDIVSKYLYQKHAQRESPNDIEILGFRDCSYFHNNPNDKNYVAAKRAIERIWGVEPDVTREGASIPVASYLQKVTGKSLLMLPICPSTNECHKVNENVSKEHLIKGTKLIVAYFYEIAFSYD